MKTMTIMLIAVMLTSVIPPLYAEAQTGPEEPQGSVTIDGAGASFPFPLIDRWRVEINRINDDLNLNYQSIGSGGGVKQHIEGTVSFAGTDAPLTVAEMEAVSSTLHIPETIGAVNVVYNLDGVSDGLNLKGPVIADIFEGKITKWNDPAIAADNPGVDLPSSSIAVVYRSDGSGTTKVFTQWLSSVSESWDENVGNGKSVGWPTGRGSPGNEGVANTLLTTEGAIGYVSIAYAVQNDIKSVAVENGDKSGFVYPSLDTTANAAGELAKASLPQPNEAWHAVNLLNAPGADSYPIATFTYLLVYEDVTDVADSRNEALALIWMIYWMLTDGQQYASELGFVPLPDEVIGLGKEGLGMVQYEGSALWEYAPAASAASDSQIPEWVAGVFKLYGDGQIDDSTLISALQFLIQQGIIKTE